jgi:hypothetical protein
MGYGIVTMDINLYYDGVVKWFKKEISIKSSGGGEEPYSREGEVIYKLKIISLLLS